MAANRRRPRRGPAGPDVLAGGDTGPRQPQGGARTGPGAFLESGDLEAREFGVPQADLPGGIRHVVNPETHPHPPAAPPERPADYHKYHGVPSDNGLYDLPPDDVTPAPRPQKIPDLHNAVPVFTVEDPGKVRVHREAIPFNIRVPVSGNEPARVCNLDHERVRIGLLNEDQTTNIRFSNKYDELLEGRGAILPATTSSYTWVDAQGPLWASSVSASASVLLSVIIITEIPD